MRAGIVKITRRAFYDKGGFANPRLFRRQRKGRCWEYFEVID